jgi:hypothetical protein
MDVAVGDCGHGRAVAFDPWRSGNTRSRAAADNHKVVWLTALMYDAVYPQRLSKALLWATDGVATM